MKVYLDNAATTPMSKEVWEAMEPYMKEDFGNPSSTHSFGRKTKNAIEQARKSIAKYLNAEPREIIFTAGGTEADNLAIWTAVKHQGVKRIITSRIEHHAVLHTVEHIAQQEGVSLVFVDLDEVGNVSITHLETLLKDTSQKTLVTLMHANNEIGNLLPIHEVSKLCKQYDALFHSDTVQTMGHYEFDLEALPIDFLTCSAHKFHGPKGVGFLYVRKGINIAQLVFGGSQERGHRAGTENVYGIVGLAKAFELAYTDLQAHQTHVQKLKTYMKEKLAQLDASIVFNGAQEEANSLYTVLNVGFPKSESNSMLLFNLDIKGVAASGGSACTSGSNQGSHVISQLAHRENYIAIRFSFSRYTTKEEIDFALNVIDK